MALTKTFPRAMTADEFLALSGKEQARILKAAGQGHSVANQIVNRLVAAASKGHPGAVKKMADRPELLKNLPAKERLEILKQVAKGTTNADALKNIAQEAGVPVKELKKAIGIDTTATTQQEKAKAVEQATAPNAAQRAVNVSAAKAAQVQKEQNVIVAAKKENTTQLSEVVAPITAASTVAAVMSQQPVALAPAAAPEKINKALLEFKQGKGQLLLPVPKEQATPKALLTAPEQQKTGLLLPQQVSSQQMVEKFANNRDEPSMGLVRALPGPQVKKILLLGYAATG